MGGGEMYDVLIKNGKVITGTGNPWLYGDVAIVKDKIVKIDASGNPDTILAAIVSAIE